jgi:hypothetical protein
MDALRGKAEKAKMNVPHEPVGWFLFLLWIGLMVPLVFVFVSCVLRLTIREVRILWQWFSGRTERHDDRFYSLLRSTIENSCHPTRAREERILSRRPSNGSVKGEDLVDVEDLVVGLEGPAPDSNTNVAT